MLTAVIVIFVCAYAAIALEHPIRINKSASALIGAGLLWTVYSVMSGDHALVGQQLNESLASTAQIVFFLLGAMTIVEVVDAHDGFENRCLFQVHLTSFDSLPASLYNLLSGRRQSANEQ